MRRVLPTRLRRMRIARRRAWGLRLRAFNARHSVRGCRPTFKTSISALAYALLRPEVLSLREGGLCAGWARCGALWASWLPRPVVGTKAPLYADFSLLAKFMHLWWRGLAGKRGLFRIKMRLEAKAFSWQRVRRTLLVRAGIARHGRVRQAALGALTNAKAANKTGLVPRRTWALGQCKAYAERLQTRLMTALAAVADEADLQFSPETSANFLFAEAAQAKVRVRIGAARSKQLARKLLLAGRAQLAANQATHKLAIANRRVAYRATYPFKIPVQNVCASLAPAIRQRGNALRVRVNYAHPTVFAPRPGLRWCARPKFMIKIWQVVLRGSCYADMRALATAVRDLRPLDNFTRRGVQLRREKILTKSGKEPLR